MIFSTKLTPCNVLYNIVWDESMAVSLKAVCKPQGILVLMCQRSLLVLMCQRNLLILMCQRSLLSFWSRFKEDMSDLEDRDRLYRLLVCMRACGL